MPGASGGHSSGGSHVGATKKGGPLVPGRAPSPGVPSGVETQQRLVQPLSSGQIGVVRQNAPQPARILGTKGGVVTPTSIRRVPSGPRFTREF